MGVKYLRAREDMAIAVRVVRVTTESTDKMVASDSRES
jgi:hypothetical protein